MQQAPRSLGRGLRRDDHACRVAQVARAQTMSEARGSRRRVSLRQLPGGQIEERCHDRQSRGDGHRSPGRVIQGAGGARFLRPGRDTHLRAAQQERIEGQACRTKEPRGRRQTASCSDRQAGRFQGCRGIVADAPDHERKGLARQGVSCEGLEQSLQISGRDGRTLPFLERAHVHDDSRPRCSSTPRPRSIDPMWRGRLAAHRQLPGARRGERPRNSSQRSRSTTSSASTMMRRDILLSPSSRSVKMMGTSTMHRPRRSAR